MYLPQFHPQKHVQSSQTVYAKSGGCHKAYGPLSVFSRYSHCKKRRGGCHKASGPLLVRSRYSQDEIVWAGCEKEQRGMAPLAYHYLSLHNQAVYKAQKPTTCSTQATCRNNFATAGPPMAMRENCTPSAHGDSGNQLRTHPKMDKTTLKLSSHNIANSSRKCRSYNARTERKTRRASCRREHRQRYRIIKAQATDLADQSRLFAQEPAMQTKVQ